jgi:uncharacterized protein YifE (UPF0438 family)
MAEELTPEEWALIQKYLPAYKRLAEGQARLTTDARKHFVRVCRGEAVATTPHEIAYMKWRQWVAAQQIAERNSRADSSSGLEDAPPGTRSYDRRMNEKLDIKYVWEPHWRD